MLRNVLAAYLDSLTERQLDIPIMFLLRAMGFYDIHLLHGQVEFGKDFIAKNHSEGDTIQYVIQSKSGNINQSTWRRDIQPQLFDAVFNTLSHPSYNATLPRQVILVTTGELRHNASIGLQNFNTDTVERMGHRPVVFWGRGRLIELFSEYGLDAVLDSTIADYYEHGRFWVLCGQAMQGDIAVRDIEIHSRHWIRPSSDILKQVLRFSLEAEILSGLCLKSQLHYEAMHSILALIRMLIALSYHYSDAVIAQLYDDAISRLYTICAEYMRSTAAPIRDQGGLAWLCGAEMTVYLCLCARLMEIASLAYFGASSNESRADAASFLAELITAEPGCGRPLSDRYSVSLVMAALVLIDTGRTTQARKLITDATVWLCDRYESGLGLAGMEAEELVETKTLLGYPFGFINVPSRATSFLASTLADLAAFYGDADLYADVVNDIAACEIHPEYWQAADSAGACSIESEDVRHYVTVRFRDTLSGIAEGEYATHMPYECDQFQFIELLGPAACVPLMILLRDRYFPKQWRQLVPNRAIAT